MWPRIPLSGGGAWFFILDWLSRVVLVRGGDIGRKRVSAKCMRMVREASLEVEGTICSLSPVWNDSFDLFA